MQNNDNLSKKFLLPDDGAGGLPSLPFEMMGMGYGGVFMLAFQVKSPPKPTPQQQPSPLNPQQKDFDDCARAAIRTFRRAERSAIAKIAVGTLGVALTGAVGRAAGAANAAAAYSGVRIVAYSSRYRLGQALQIGGDIGIAFTGTLLVNGFVDSTSNHAKKRQCFGRLCGKIASGGS